MPQFEGYRNRFGPGLVIYWFGFIDELNTMPGVQMLDHFPEEVLCLDNGSLSSTPAASAT